MGSFGSIIIIRIIPSGPRLQSIPIIRLRLKISCFLHNNLMCLPRVRII